ncbi:Transcriptional regulator of acetoin/glycerol metabolism [Roseovarius marisflavi]|uniref:Transcriptional regulator of acetoin/glycerol metabolism n=1 Tax=Roseovarius marisflavi TaxID=1054996 RepID=A0A1M7AUM7_9RHOB|nr:sigma-54-dependent Fis family transcriptional regulator [Roseovarius marisflavi]SHL46424.1 Transcriptional regulator of acetoin/glycerol metabolism [Roseovarius marisflavi]
MFDLDHVDEIDRVLRGVETGRDRLVSDSWRRCVDTYGMDPSRPDPAHIVTETELREHREQSERLIATARSGLQALFRQVAGQNYVLLLANAQGVCVDFFGDPRFEDQLRQAGLYLGSNWTEDLAGTCGVGSCIVTHEAITIHQSDHFGLAHMPLSCTAAPIFDTHGELSAVLDISLLRSPSPKSTQNLAMSLVTASARRVEMANLMAMTRRDWVLRFSTSPEFLEVDPEAAVALDGSGRIVGITSGARRTLDPKGHARLIGSRIDDWLELRIDDLPDLMRGRPTEERVLRMKDGRGLFGHAIAPQTPQMTAALRRHVSAPPGALGSFAGPDPALERLLAQAARLAPTQVPLLMTGETGTGKEKLARAIHVACARGRGFHALRCGGSDMIAALDEVGPGTVFLRGVENLSTDAQSAVLTLLDRRADLRILASCRCTPMALSEVLRDDLFFRLAGATLSLPPLRHRGDLDWLIDRLLRRSCTEDIRLSPAARAELKSRPWPGNIRELEQVLEVAVALCEGMVIDLPDLPAPPQQAAPQPSEGDDLEALLKACGWNMAQAARRMGVNRSTVLRRIRKAGLSPPT